MVVNGPEPETNQAPSSPITIANVWSDSFTLQNIFLACIGSRLLVGFYPGV